MKNVRRQCVSGLPFGCLSNDQFISWANFYLKKIYNNLILPYKLRRPCDEKFFKELKVAFEKNPIQQISSFESLLNQLTRIPEDDFTIESICGTPFLSKFYYCLSYIFYNKKRPIQKRIFENGFVPKKKKSDLETISHEVIEVDIFPSLLKSKIWHTCI
jgi:hypothetical protein